MTDGFGCDRRKNGGTGYAGYYSPALRAALEQPETTPLELLGFFHNLPWTTPLALDGSTKQWRLASAGEAAGAALETKTLLQYVQDGHAAALAEAQLLGQDWASLKGGIDEFRHAGVQASALRNLPSSSRVAALSRSFLTGSLWMHRRRGWHSRSGTRRRSRSCSWATGPTSRRPES